MQKEYKTIGLMSGTSMDGLDIAYCTFGEENGNWNFKILEAETMPYEEPWSSRLKTASQLTSVELLELNAAFGWHLGESVSRFLATKNLPSPQIIASHGHTVFHQPERGFTYQIGSGQHIHAATGIPVVWDFRSLDVALGGQGAPLVPIGDRLLFPEYSTCLNLGGIANISFEQDGLRKAYDVCFANIGLNYLAEKAGKRFDDNGAMARSGKLNESLLSAILAVYHSMVQKPSLSREWFEEKLKALLDQDDIDLADRMHTFSESIAVMIAQNLRGDKVLVTGGGALNTFLMERIQALVIEKNILMPDKELIAFKEALIFAFLGVLKLRGEVNCLSSVTGSSRDSVSGMISGY